jgi:hypothetical protein
MKTDPIVEEIRKGRMKHAEKFDFDPSKIAEDYRRMEEKYKDRMISGKPKPAPTLRKTGS